MKKYIRVTVLSLSFILLFAPVGKRAYAIDISASAACVIDADSGRVLYEKNAHERRGMASTTKIMTAIVAIEHAPLGDTVTVSSHATQTEGTSMGLACGEEITLEALLNGLLLASGNDAAVAIAEHIGGSVAGFSSLMNEKANELSLSDTQFQNPHGLTAEGHYTSAYDLAMITRYAMGNEAFCAIVGKADETVLRNGGEFRQSLHNHNRLLSELSGCIGVKTGFTKAAGRCLVTAGNRDDKRLICVTFNDPDDWNDHKNLTEEMCARYHAVSLVEKGEIMQTIQLGESGEPIRLVANESLRALLDNEEATRVYSDCNISPVTESVEVGEMLGTATFYCDGREIGSVSLVSDRTRKEQPRRTLWSSWNRLIRIFFTKVSD